MTRLFPEAETKVRRLSTDWPPLREFDAELFQEGNPNEILDKLLLAPVDRQTAQLTRLLGEAGGRWPGHWVQVHRAHLETWGKNPHAKGLPGEGWNGDEELRAVDTDGSALGQGISAEV
jgi:hypothetical protein